MLSVNYHITNQLDRVQELMDLIRDKTMLPKQKEQFDFILPINHERLKRHFEKRYWELIEK